MMSFIALGYLQWWWPPPRPQGPSSRGSGSWACRRQSRNTASLRPHSHGCGNLAINMIFTEIQLLAWHVKCCQMITCGTSFRLIFCAPAEGLGIVGSGAQGDCRDEDYLESSGFKLEWSTRKIGRSTWNNLRMEKMKIKTKTMETLQSLFCYWHLEGLLLNKNLYNHQFTFLLLPVIPRLCRVGGRIEWWKEERLNGFELETRMENEKVGSADTIYLKE